MDSDFFRDVFNGGDIQILAPGYFINYDEDEKATFIETRAGYPEIAYPYLFRRPERNHLIQWLPAST